MNSVIKIPIESWVKAYLFNRYPDKVIQDRYFDLRSHTIGSLRQIKFTICELGKKYQPTDSSTFDLRGEVLELVLPINYAKINLTKDQLKSLGKVFESIAKTDIVNFVSVLASIPFFNISSSIRIFFEMYGLTDDMMDQDHIRRYVDRYHKTIIGESFDKTSDKLNKFLIKFLDEKYGKR